MSHFIHEYLNFDLGVTIQKNIRIYAILGRSLVILQIVAL